MGHVSGSAPDWIRTTDLQLRRLPLYPTELRARGGRSYAAPPAPSIEGRRARRALCPKPPLELHHDDAAARIHEHVISTTVPARSRVVAVPVVRGGDDLVARHALQRDRRSQVLTHSRLPGPA